MKTVTAAEMKEIERRADESGLSYYAMMENAGTAAYEIIKGRYPDAESFLIFCGKGNNGGDGFVVARLSSLEGKKVCVVLAEGLPRTADALTNYEKLPSSVLIKGLEDALPKADVVIDALYGTGFHGELRAAGKKACCLMNNSGVPLAALDIPSGLGADTGIAAEGAVKADICIAFDSFKKAHCPPHPNCGSCIRADIGIPEECRKGLGEGLPE